MPSVLCPLPRWTVGAMLTLEQTYGAACTTSPYDTSSCYASDCRAGSFHLYLEIWNKYVIKRSLEHDIRSAVVQSRSMYFVRNTLVPTAALL